MQNKPLTLLKNFGFGRDKPPASTEAPPTADDGADEHLLATRREAVRVAVKDCLREHGMPATWVGSDVGVMPADHGHGQTLAIRLIVQEWQAALLPYLPALEMQIMLALVRKDGGFDHSADVVSWQFARDCGYPQGGLPDPDFWHPDKGRHLAQTTSAQASAGQPQQASKFDLPATEQAHNKDGKKEERDLIPSEFSASVPEFLNTVPGSSR